MIKTIKTLLSYSLTRYVLVALVAVGVGAWLHWYIAGPTVTIVREPGETKVERVYVDKEVLVPRDVLKYVVDKKEVERLLNELSFLENKVAILTESIKVLESKGGGTIVYRDVPGPAGKTVREATFKDWRLNFMAKDDVASYTLSQKFEVLSTAGRDINGKPTATTRLFEIDDTGTRIPATAVSQTVIAGNATDGKQHWFAGLNLHAGIGYTQDIKTHANAPGGVIGVRWLTHGYTKAAEDGVLAFASPVALVDQKGKTEVGILPISWNAGNVLPMFKDLWVSPVVTTKTTMPIGVSRIGFSVTATF